MRRGIKKEKTLFQTIPDQHRPLSSDLGRIKKKKLMEIERKNKRKSGERVGRVSSVHFFEIDKSCLTSVCTFRELYALFRHPPPHAPPPKRLPFMFFLFLFLWRTTVCDHRQSAGWEQPRLVPICGRDRAPGGLQLKKTQVQFPQGKKENKVLTLLCCIIIRLHGLFLSSKKNSD